MDVERKWVEREKCSEAASVSRLLWVVVLLEVVFLPVTQPRETPGAVFTWQPEYKQPRADSEAKFVFVFLPLVLSSVLGAGSFIPGCFLLHCSALAGFSPNMWQRTAIHLPGVKISACLDPNRCFFFQEEVTVRRMCFIFCPLGDADQGSERFPGLSCVTWPLGFVSGAKVVRKKLKILAVIRNVHKQEQKGCLFLKWL